MLNLPDQRDFTDLRFVHKAATIYALLAILIIPAGYMILMLLMPAQLRKFKAAADPYEKTFWKLTIAGWILMIASIILFGLFFIELHRTSLLLDGLAALALGFGAVCVTDYFGKADKIHEWHKPNGNPPTKKYQLKVEFS